MGYMLHHTIVVTSCIDPIIEAAHARARELFPWVSDLSPAGINGHRSFFVPPDSSKEGWPESDEGDRQRAQFIRWLNAQRYGDGTSSLDWIEVAFGGDDADVVRVRLPDRSPNRSGGGAK